MQTRFASFFALLLSAALASACAAGAEDSVTGSGSASLGGRPYFEVFPGADGEYRFHFTGGNHEIVLSSEGYERRVGALNGVLSVLHNGGFRDSYEIREASDGQHYFVLRAANGEIIGMSELYGSRSGADAGVANTIEAVASYVEYWSNPSGERFEIFEAKRQFYFRLVAGNGEVVLQSQAYKQEAAAMNGAFSVSENGLHARSYDIREAADGGYYFAVKAKNGQVIGTSEVYSTRSNAVRGRDDVIALLPDAQIL